MWSVSLVPPRSPRVGCCSLHLFLHRCVLGEKKEASGEIIPAPSRILPFSICTHFFFSALCFPVYYPPLAWLFYKHASIILLVFTPLSPGPRLSCGASAAPRTREPAKGHRQSGRGHDLPLLGLSYTGAKFYRRQTRGPTVPQLGTPYQHGARSPDHVLKLNSHPRTPHLSRQPSPRAPAQNAACSHNGSQCRTAGGLRAQTHPSDACQQRFLPLYSRRYSRRRPNGSLTFQRRYSRLPRRTEAPTMVGHTSSGKKVAAWSSRPWTWAARWTAMVGLRR